MTNDELMTKLEGKTRLRVATARQVKSEDRNTRLEDSFWHEGAESMVREEPETKHL
jgi:hypothetical protein